MAIKVDGQERILQRMYAFDKDVWKILQKDIRQATDVIRKDAQSLTPGVALSYWGVWQQGERDLGFSGPQVKNSMKTRVRSRRGRAGADRFIAGQVVMNDVAAAIFALAGSQNRSGHRFNRNLNKKYGRGPFPRLLGPAWTENVDKARKQIDAAITRAAREVTRG
jgi:hypothetical protein